MVDNKLTQTNPELTFLSVAVLYYSGSGGWYILICRLTHTACLPWQFYQNMVDSKKGSLSGERCLSVSLVFDATIFFTLTSKGWFEICIPLCEFLIPLHFLANLMVPRPSIWAGICSFHFPPEYLSEGSIIIVCCLHFDRTWQPILPFSPSTHSKWRNNMHESADVHPRKLELSSNEVEGIVATDLHRSIELACWKILHHHYYAKNLVITVATQIVPRVKKEAFWKRDKTNLVEMIKPKAEYVICPFSWTDKHDL